MAATSVMTAEEALRAPPPAVEWLQTLELNYDLGGVTASAEVPSCCFGCGVAENSPILQSPASSSSFTTTNVTGKVKLSKCARCQVASYCSKDCQVQDWKSGGHKMACSAYGRVGPEMILSQTSDQQDARVEIFGRIRFYACPYAVHNTSKLGRGFLFIQSDSTLACLSLPLPKDCHGRPLTMRFVLLHYLTMGEYDTEVCREDFELAHVRKKLSEAVQAYDEQKEVVVLMRFRCGHVALGRAALVPDFCLCQRLGHDYYAQNSAEALQLNLDDL